MAAIAHYRPRVLHPQSVVVPDGGHIENFPTKVIGFGGFKPATKNCFNRYSATLATKCRDFTVSRGSE